MHEAPVTQRILDMAREAAGQRPVLRIHLMMGRDCGFHAECIALYFEALREHTSCENAELTFAEAEDSHAFYVNSIEVDDDP